MTKKVAWMMVVLPVGILFVIGCIFCPLPTLTATALLLGTASVAIGSAWLLSNSK